MAIVSDIKTFFTTSTREENDATNKIRESVLKIIDAPPQEYLEHSEFGSSWHIVHTAWKNALQKIAEETNVPVYTTIRTVMRGGRRYNYDADIMYFNDTTLIANRKIEFKNGGTSIGDLPQFLSLQVKVGLFSETYDSFWYINYLDEYLRCDAEITVAKPPLDSYLKAVTKTNYNSHAFFAQLKQREHFFQKEKDAVVNESITDYLRQYASNIDIHAFSEKVRLTQTGKIYLLWCNGAFCIDKLLDTEMNEMKFHSIKNGNVLEVKSGNTIYGLLLRWRNHKGILNPAWQISMKRQSKI